MCFHSFLNPSMVGVEEDNGGGAALNYYDFSGLENFISSNGAKLESINCLAIDDDPATPNQHIYDPLSPFISRNKVKLSSNTRERAQRTAPIKQFFSMSPNIINNLKTLPICPFASLSIRLSYPPFVLSIRTYISNPKGLLPAANRFKPPSTLSSSLCLPLNGSVRCFNCWCWRLRIMCILPGPGLLPARLTDHINIYERISRKSMAHT